MEAEASGRSDADGSEPPVRKRKKRSDAIARREKIVETAREQFVERGLNGTTTRELAAAAGMTESAMFRHFSTKYEIFEESVVQHLDEIMTGALNVDVSDLESAGSGEERLEVLRGQHRHYLEVMERILPMFGVLLFSDRAVGQEFYQERFYPFLDRMAKASPEAMGSWANRGADAEMLIFSAFGTYLMLAIDSYFRGTELDHEAAAEKLAWLLLYGVGGRPADSEK